MGRLFWKFFLIVWLTQLAAIAATGTLFWLERERLGEQMSASPPPWSVAAHPPPARGEHGKRPPHRPPPPPGIPVLHIVTGLLASLLSAAAIAGYVVRPLRRLRLALATAASGDLSQRIAPAMGRRKDELAELAQAFDHMSDRLHSLMQAQRRLLHDVSHELRSPLARLQAAVGLARQQPARFEESLDRLQREGERMDRLVGELLTLARLEAGETTAPERFELGELLADLVDDASFEGASRQVAIQLERDDGLTVQADPNQLHRAIDNVLRNALRHAPNHSTITVRCRQVSPQTIRLLIEDQGEGAPPALLDQLFEPFVRAAPEAGFGLGLAIARRAILAAGGEISAENMTEGGFRVRITLPLVTSG